jgi:SlyX protein
MDSRITELEIKIAFTEDLLDEVNRSLWRQQRLIETLQQEMRALRSQLASIPAGAAGDSLRDEIPPHY